MKKFKCHKDYGFWNQDIRLSKLSQLGDSLTEEQKAGNREKSRVRSRVEHIFGFMENSTNGMYIQCIGMKRAKKEDTSYILLGDFNIPKVVDDTMKALEKYGFTVPSAIKEHPTDLGGTNHYDPIAFNLKLDDKMTVFSEEKQKGGAFNFAETIYTEKDLETYREYFPDKIKGKTEQEIRKYYLSTWRTFQISDHLPLWVELKIDFSNQYLEKIKGEV
jgi:hypothetical protein